MMEQLVNVPSIKTTEGMRLNFISYIMTKLSNFRSLWYKILVMTFPILFGIIAILIIMWRRHRNSRNND